MRPSVVHTSTHRSMTLTYPSIPPFIHPANHLSIYISIQTCACRSICLSACLPLCLFIYSCIIYLSQFLSISVSLYLLLLLLLLQAIYSAQQKSTSFGESEARKSESEARNIYPFIHPSVYSCSFFRPSIHLRHLFIYILFVN